MKSYNKAIKANREDEVAMYNKGRILMRLGKWKLALETLEKILALDPNHGGAQEAKQECLDNMEG